MVLPKNPFQLTEITTPDLFCDRDQELKQLVSYAQSSTSVVIYSPRRFGKTSLVKQVQAKLRKQGAVTLYTDFFAVTSIEDIASRIAKAVFQVTHAREKLFKKAITFFSAFRPVFATNDRGDISVSVQPAFKTADIHTLEQTVEAIDRLGKDTEIPISVVFDEFQEILEIDGATKIEAALRTTIQKSNYSYFFVGSRRRLLLDMFNNRDRPFFQSSLNFELPPLPVAQATEYIIDRFQVGGKTITESLAKEVIRLVQQHPGYLQKYCFFLYEISEKTVGKTDLMQALDAVLTNEQSYFESILQGLNVKQKVLLRAIAKEPIDKLYTKAYMMKHDLPSTGSTQKSVATLVNMDLIEQNPGTKVWKVVDPLLILWLNRNF